MASEFQTGGECPNQCVRGTQRPDCSCHCPPGWTGLECNTPSTGGDTWRIPELGMCTKTCMNGVVNPATCTCLCYPGWTGPTCSQLSRAKRQANCACPGNGFTPQEKQALVDRHNFHRANVNPMASDMTRMVWDDDLANCDAQAYANRCIWAHGTVDLTGCPYDFSTPQYRGQNLFPYPAFTAHKPHDIAKMVVDSFYGEVQYYEYLLNKCATGKHCGQYKQVVWAISNRLGCGIAYCSTGSPFEQIPNWWNVVCHYFPVGNYMFQKPYINGDGCSRCPEGTGGCTPDKKLCITAYECKINPSACGDHGCNKQCVNGYISSATCMCMCHLGWTGPLCDQPICVKHCGANANLNTETCMCICKQGWTGPLCDQKVDCTKNCGANGNLNTQTCTCICNQGWTGPLCDQQTCTKNCGANGNLNTQTCTCICNQGWTGPLCEQQVCTKNCGANGYLNSQTCTCICNQGWTGTLCDQQICTKNCGANGNLNTQTCTCICNQGWTGTLCDQRVCNKQCVYGTLDSQSCTCNCFPRWGGALCDQYLGGGCSKRCIHGYLDYPRCTCVCQPGWTGPTCNKRECPNNCVRGTQRPDCSCQCPPGWTGLDCNTPSTVCQKNCGPHGTLHVPSCTCRCEPGWTGTLCTKRLCTKTCMNGVVNPATCTCLCYPGWTGPTCSQRE
ncbi:multiple epidermal growth factor-like domains protein 10 [Lingula anatina]|uniref:Multiple epidermal growth factor-like domains protein 10 n=1 Tax=Lingula anatina TaxID=7574 RepID=A0A1S3ILJ0_LINAN|nr:multiple epidermal growth factor-like domains protein 10 [Lingula anatina]|eukprot:XP_013399082.1 multiple epidermal growth factor-like domains protein 10 [Lingula anatina]